MISKFLIPLIFTALPAILLCKQSDQHKNCSDFKNGKFIYIVHLPEGDKIFHIVRNDSLQSEVEEGTGKFSHLFVKWTGNCDFELKLIETSFDFSDSVQNIRKTIPLKVEILSSTKNYYIFQAKRENTNFLLTDTMWIEKQLH
jgi:hypothetical protein